MTIRNLTGREVVIWDDNGPTDNRFPPEGIPQTRTSGPSGGVVVDKAEGGIPIVDVRLNRVNLPERESNTQIITHQVTAQAAAAQGRQTDDLLIPQNPVRMSLANNEIIENEDDDGNNIIVGWRQLGRLQQ